MHNPAESLAETAVLGLGVSLLLIWIKYQTALRDKASSREPAFVRSQTASRPPTTQSSQSDRTRA